MGTKNNPGKFDCWGNAADDEPLFILRANDPQAPDMVRRWIAERLLVEFMGGRIQLEDQRYQEKLEEALKCSSDMLSWNPPH